MKHLFFATLTTDCGYKQVIEELGLSLVSYRSLLSLVQLLRPQWIILSAVFGFRASVSQDVASEIEQ